MKFSDEMRVPYVPKEVCEYLRDTYSLPHVLYQVTGADSAMALGMMVGINLMIERLEAIVAQQEGDKD